MTPDEIAERTASLIAAWLRAEATSTRATAEKYYQADTQFVMIAKADALDQAALDVARGAWLP